MIQHGYPSSEDDGFGEELDDEDESEKITALLFTGSLTKLGHRDFRPGQLDALLALSKGHDVNLQLSTGSGKSLVHQIFTNSYKGIGLVFVPTVGIIEDQLKKLEGKISAVGLRDDWQDYANSIVSKKFKILYMTPEWLITKDGLFSDRKIEFLKLVTSKAGFNLITIDEAHLLGEWSTRILGSASLVSISCCLLLSSRFFPSCLR